MEEQILISIKLRPGISNNSDDLLKDLISDTITDVKAFINYAYIEELPVGCISIVKELVIAKCNKLGSEGISSESHEGVSQSYTNDMPKDIKKKLYRYRKLVWV